MTVKSQNSQSRHKTVYTSNQSGYRGVSWNEKAKKWVANIHVYYNQKFLGYFDNIDAANDAYVKARNFYFIEGNKVNFDNLTQEELALGDLKKIKKLIKNCKYKEKNKEKVKEYNRQYWYNIKSEIIQAYGGQCECCGENLHEFMTIDHIDGTGYIDNKTRTQAIYLWLIDNNFPKNNFRLLCWNCNCAKGSFGYCPHHPPPILPELNTDQIYLRKLKLDTIQEYGSVCVCCGESLIEFLTIDHINNDGAEHRKKIKRSSLYKWLKDNNYPKDNFQLLCWNCNAAKGKYGYCPHTKG